MDERLKKVTTIAVGVLIFVILLILVSYAFFSTRLEGQEQIVKVGDLDLILNETSEGITLDKAIGLSDEDGMNLSPATFELKNNSGTAVD